jgi:hypothetical protein
VAVGINVVTAAKSEDGCGVCLKEVLELPQAPRAKKIVITHPCVKGLSPTSLQAAVDGFTYAGPRIIDEGGAIFQGQRASDLCAKRGNHNERQVNILALRLYSF